MKLRLLILFSFCILASNLSASDSGSDSDSAPIVPVAPLPAPNFEHVIRHLGLARAYTLTALQAIDNTSLPHPLNPNRAADVKRVITALNAALVNARIGLEKEECEKKEYPKE